MELQYRKNDKTGEELYYTTHSSGLGIYIIPKKITAKRMQYSVQDTALSIQSLLYRVRGSLLKCLTV